MDKTNQVFGLEDVEYEIVDRCREGKVSYHVRWDYSINRDLLTYFLKKQTSEEPAFAYVDY